MSNFSGMLSGSKQLNSMLYNYLWVKKVIVSITLNSILGLGDYVFVYL